MSVGNGFEKAHQQSQLKIIDNLRREWRWLVIAVLLSGLGAYAYQSLVMPQYRLQQTLVFQPNYLAGKLGEQKLTPAEFGQEILASAVASDGFQESIRHIPGLSVDTDDEAAKLNTIRQAIHVNVDTAANAVSFDLTMPFPHQAADILGELSNAVLHSEPSAAGTQAANGKAMLDAASLDHQVAASADVAPIGPPPRSIYGAAALFGLVVGVIIAMYRGVYHRRILSPEQISAELQIATAGYLPRISNKLSTAGKSLAAYSDPTSEVATQSRAALLHLFKARQPSKGQAMIVTSPQTREGRTTTAANLASMLALTNEPVLLIDANLQAPAIHKLFGLADSALGFCESLDNPAAVSDFVRPTHIEHLSFLSCGKMSSGAAAKMQSPNLDQLLTQLKERFTHIVFDAGALQANPEAAALASKCDTALLVCNARSTSTAKAAAVISTLEGLGITNVHAIVNDLPTSLAQKHFKSQRLVYTSTTITSRPEVEISKFGLTA